MAKAVELPSGTWRVRVYAGKRPDGRKEYLSICANSEKEANYLASKYEYHHKEIVRDPANMTLGEAIDRYIESKDGILSPTTVRSYKSMRRNRLPGLMDVQLSRISRDQLQRAINHESKTLSPKTVKNIYGLVTAAVGQYAPRLAEQIEGRRSVALPQQIDHEQMILEPSELTILFKAIRDTPMEIPVMLAVWLGMRQSEITGLQWNCIDFRRGTLRIKQALVRNADGDYVMKTTKTRGSTRTIHLPDCLITLLKAAKKDAANDFVVNLSAQSLYRRLKTILRKNDLPDIRFHDLRHCNNTVMLSLGIPDKYARQRCGWTTNSPAKRAYDHIMLSKRTEYDDIIDSYFCKLRDDTDATKDDTTRKMA